MYRFDQQLNASQEIVDANELRVDRVFTQAVVIVTKRKRHARRPVSAHDER